MKTKKIVKYIQYKIEISLQNKILQLLRTNNSYIMGDMMNICSLVTELKHQRHMAYISKWYSCLKYQLFLVNIFLTVLSKVANMGNTRT